VTTTRNHVQDEDGDLLRRFARGDRDALGELAARYEAPLLGLATGLLGGRGDLAREAVQDAWTKVIRYAGSFEGRSSVRTWLYRIVINRCHDLRARREPVMGVNGTLDGVERSSDPGLSPGGTRGLDEDGRVRDALEALSDAQRLIVLLCYHRGLSHEQAARVLDIPMGTLKSRLHAALVVLRSRLGEEETP
jgi:RNA polymerase sigma-70 factor (ECF subfamily)